MKLGDSGGITLRELVVLKLRVALDVETRWRQLLQSDVDRCDILEESLPAE
jgi:hypothetical protein